MSIQRSFGIRKATRDDLPALVELYRQSARFHVQIDKTRYRVPVVPAISAWFLQRWPASSTKIIIAERAARTAGYALIEVLLPADPASMIQPARAATLGVAVDSEFRQRGLGFALLEAAQDWAKAREVEQIFLDYHHQNFAARRLHKKAGYQVAGVFLVKRLDGP